MVTFSDGVPRHWGMYFDALSSRVSLPWSTAMPTRIDVNDLVIEYAEPGDSAS